MAKDIRGVVRLDKVTSVYVGHIESVVAKEEELENGMIGVLGAPIETEDGGVERELVEFKEIEDVNEPIHLIAHPEINYEEYKSTDYSLQNFFLPEGKPARAYKLQAGDIVSVSKEVFKALGEKAEIGNFVGTEVGSRCFTEFADEPTGAFVGKIVDLNLLGTATHIGQAGIVQRPIELVAIRVIKNS